jgi:hypothetical protein
VNIDCCGSGQYRVVDGAVGCHFDRGDDSRNLHGNGYESVGYARADTGEGRFYATIGKAF